MDFLESAKSTFRKEAQAIQDLENYLSQDFEKAVIAINNCKGRVIVTGVGKSGLIGAKLAATFASTGTPSFFVHPVEAVHGDLGMITKDDLVLILSYSGKTDEVLRIIPWLKKNNIPVISITGNASSLLASNSTYHLCVTVKEEACPLNLAPTSSTTATLVMGDALAIALMQLKDFKEIDFAEFHPGGNIGYRLLTQVKDVMQKENLPLISKDTTIIDSIFEISKAKLGLAIIIENGVVLGIVTDGDIRRSIQTHRASTLDMRVEEIMTKKPITISHDATLNDAELLMKKNKIHTLLISDDNNSIVGVLDSVKLVN